MGCPGERVDQLEPVATGAFEPSTLDSTIGPNTEAQAAIVGDQLVVLDPSTGDRVLLNASAALVYTAFDDQRRLGDVVAQMTHETGVATDDLTPDVLATVDRLLSQGLLTRGDVAAISPQQDSMPAGTAFDDAGDPTVGRIWSFDSGVRRATGIPVVVRVESAALAADVEAALAALAPIATPTNNGDVSRIEVIADASATTAAAPAPDEPTAQIVVNGQVRSNKVPHHNAATYLFDQLDAVLVARTPGLRFHAGAVERDGNVVVVLGQSGHGKSTLTAALVQAGWRYVTDELVAVTVGATSFDVTPYARPLDLNASSLDRLGIDGPDLVTGSRKNKVFPTRLGQVSAGGRVAAIVVLTGEAAESGPAVADLPAAEAVMAILGLTFAATFDDSDALSNLARLCSTTPTMRLHRAPIGDMVRAVEDAVASRTSSDLVG